MLINRGAVAAFRFAETEMAMQRAFSSETVKSILASGGGLRISCEGLSVATMEEYAAYAAQGRARLELIVGDAVLPRDALTEIAAMGKGYVLFDLVS